MKQKEPCLLISGMDIDKDRISNLPGHIVDKILSLLSIKDAVRMSLLSSKWRYKWITLPDIVFDNHCISVSSQDSVKSKLVNIVDHVLLLHTGPINKFRLSHRDLIAIPDIDRWILYLSWSPIKELILEIWKGPRYKLPSCLYSCQNLIHLEIFNCLLKPPSNFGGFRNLRSLDLQHITMDQDVFDYLIISCPLLKKLTLMNFDGFTHLNIHAPNLQLFDVGGVFEDVTFKDVPLLRVVAIGLYTICSSGHGNSNLLKFFNHLPLLQRLEVQNYLLRYLTYGIVPPRLPSPCVHLNYLSIHINLQDTEENEVALCILRSSPNLQELEILARAEENHMGGGTNFWEEDRHRDCPFDKLRRVKVVGIALGKPELGLINALLANSPVLEKMTLKPGSCDGRWEFVKELLRRPRASVQAEIIYQDP